MDTNWRSLFRYDAWANELTLSSVRDQGDAGDEARKLLAHVLSAQLIWLSRLLQETRTVDVWQSMTIEQMTRHTRDLSDKWSSFLSDAADELHLPCVYQNTKGERFETPAAEILMHVVVHSAYHRGQVAAALRNLELVPAVTDYIAFTRR